MDLLSFSAGTSLQFALLVRNLLLQHGAILAEPLGELLQFVGKIVRQHFQVALELRPLALRELVGRIYVRMCSR